jgi:uncharacterized protein YlaN (UPF0358 family)
LQDGNIKLKIMKTARLFFYIAVALCVAIMFYLLCMRPVPVDTSTYTRKIDSLNVTIAGHERTIELLRAQRDTIRDTIRIIRTRIIEVPGQIALLPPEQIAATWDTLTGEYSPTHLLNDSTAITHLKRIQSGVVALVQIPLYERQVQLQQSEIRNLDNQLVLKDSIINGERKKIALYSEENTGLRKQIKLQNYIITGVGVIIVGLLLR